MAKLSKEDSILLIKLVARIQNKLKGEALDLARAAFPQVAEDRQFNQFVKTIKSKELSLRSAFVEALVDSGLIERVENREIQNFR